MGAEIREVDCNTDGKADGTARTGKRGSSESTSAADTRKERTGTAGTAGTAGTGTGTETGTQKVVSGLATIDAEEEKRLERNRKRRERYAKEKEANGGQVKPRKVNGKKKDADIDTQQIDTLILSIFTVIGSRPNCEQWLLSENEVKSITKPLCAMLAESEALSVISQNSNQIALVMACITVFVPRVFVTVQKMNNKKEMEKFAKRTGNGNDFTGKQKAENQNIGRENHSRNNGHHASDGANNRANEPFIGVPIS